MNATQSHLWENLRAFRFDDEAAGLTFTGRLARENGWTPSFAARVVTEYRRFLFLAVTAGHPVTPSDEVDQAWHLHLVYSRSYWQDLCGKVLGRPLHHGPTQGGATEDHKFRQWYLDTLESYRTTFHEEPPADIWPDVDKRFDPSARFVRVNQARWLLLPRLSLRRAATIAAAGLLLAFCAVACVSEGAGKADLGILFFVLLGIVLVIAFIKAAKPGGRGKNSNPNSCGSGCGTSGCDGD